MKCLVGFAGDAASGQALHTAGLLAGADPLVVCTVTPAGWGHPSMARVDAEYEGFLQAHAAQLLQAARAQAGAQPARFIHRPAVSVAQGLLDAAADEGAELLVIGRGREAAIAGLSSDVTDALLHCAPLPVALPAAPAGVPGGDARLSRISVAFAGDARSGSTVRRAAAMAAAHGLPLRIVTLVVRNRQMYPSTVGCHAENEVADQWREQAAAAQQAVREALMQEVPGTTVRCALGDGPSWYDALLSLGWLEGEVLVLGSSPLSMIERVFVGSNARRILRDAPVPVIVLPRSRT